MSKIQNIPIGVPKSQINKRLKMDGLKFLSKLSPDTIPVAFFDPQYRGVLDKLKYGNDGVNRGKRRCNLEQMPKPIIEKFLSGIDQALIPSGHLFLWLDKFHLCEGFKDWIKDTTLDVVDLISWDKGRIGMGYRSRRTTEYLLILQKQPRRAKGIWTIHNIPDTWHEKVITKEHPHTKPIQLQSRLIEAVTKKGDFVIDPAAGSFSILEATKNTERNFIGCDING